MGLSSCVYFIFKATGRRDRIPTPLGSPYLVAPCQSSSLRLLPILNIPRGSALALSVAAIAALEEPPILGLIAIVPVVQTQPDHNSAWGKNAYSPGLTPERLLKDLRVSFGGVDPVFRDHWHSDPWAMPDQVLQRLPGLIMVSTSIDIL